MGSRPAGRRPIRGGSSQQILLFDQVVMHLEADLRWLDIVEQRLDEIKRQPQPKPLPKPRGRPKKVLARP